ncbi:MAG TPA: VOC family protein [Steroidobacteraceae bacterium]|jgi:predicted enzyme related to lactoylglutathione lyase
MPVTGIGGIFFRAQNPEALQAWYREHLGVGAAMTGNDWVWQQSAGPTVFSPFKADTDYFSRDKQWMLNFRVTGLDDLLAKLRSAGIEIVTNKEWDSPETGRFARIHDPEGNAVELWELPG